MDSFNQTPVLAPKSKKWIWIVSAIIVVIALLFGSWFYWKQQFVANAPKCGGFAGLSCPVGYECKGMAKYPDARGYCVKINAEELRQNETANWKTYTNTKYGFEFKYPADFNLSSYGNYLFELVNPDKITIRGYFPIVPGGYGFAAFDIKILQKFAPTGLENTLPTKKEFDDNTFYYYGAGGGGVYYPDQYFYNLNGELFEVTFDDQSGDKTPSSQTKELAEKILSTFKVTKPVSQNQTSVEQSSSDFGLNTEIKKILTDGGPASMVTFSVVVTGVLSRSAGDWTIQIICPEGVKVSSVAGEQNCPTEQLRAGGNNTSFRFINKTNNAQTVTAIARLLSGKDNKTPVATSKYNVEIPAY